MHFNVKKQTKQKNNIKTKKQNPCIVVSVFRDISHRYHFISGISLKFFSVQCIYYYFSCHCIMCMHYITLQCQFSAIFNRERWRCLFLFLITSSFSFCLNKELSYLEKRKRKKKISPLTSKPLRHTRLKHQRAFCILVLCMIWGKSSTNSAMYFGQFSGCFIKKNKINIYKKIIMGKKKASSKILVQIPSKCPVLLLGIFPPN